jgi:hypothetical protein
LDSKSRLHQTWFEDASHGIERSPTGRCDGVLGDAALSEWKGHLNGD